MRHQNPIARKGGAPCSCPKQVSRRRRMKSRRRCRSTSCVLAPRGGEREMREINGRSDVGARWSERGVHNLLRRSGSTSEILLAWGYSCEPPRSPGVSRSCQRRVSLQHAFGSMKDLLRGIPQEQLPFSKVQNPAQTSLPPQDAWFHRASRRRRRTRRVAARSTQAPGAPHLSRWTAGGRLLPARYPAGAVLAGGRRGAGTCFATAVPAFHPAGTRGGRGPDPRRRSGGGRGSGSVGPAGSSRDRGRR
jgi:hypothetical protein